MEPRKPTQEEKKELVDYTLKKFRKGEADREAIASIINNCFIAVYDDYYTSSPGYCAKVMVVVGNDGPEYTETYEWYRPRAKGEENWTDCKVWGSGKNS